MTRREAAATTTTGTQVRPEVYAAIALATRHQEAFESWGRRCTQWKRRRFLVKHRNKIQKHLARAARYMGATA